MVPSGNKLPYPMMRIVIGSCAAEFDEHSTHAIAEKLERNGSETSLPIPPACVAAGTLAVRLEGCAVSGFALTAS